MLLRYLNIASSLQIDITNPTRPTFNPISISWAPQRHIFTELLQKLLGIYKAEEIKQMDIGWGGDWRESRKWSISNEPFQSKQYRQK